MFKLPCVYTLFIGVAGQSHFWHRVTAFNPTISGALDVHITLLPSSKTQYKYIALELVRCCTVILDAQHCEKGGPASKYPPSEHTRRRELTFARGMKTQFRDKK